MEQVKRHTGELPKYKVGDVVQLKSGGTSMVVKKLETRNFKEDNKYIDYFMGGYYCYWFDSTGFKENTNPFHEEILMLSKEV